MQSIQSIFFKFCLRAIRKKSRAGKIHRRKIQLPGFLLRKYRVSADKINGHTYYTISPGKIAPTRTILFFHGGAYVHNFHWAHFRFIAKLVDRTSCEVIAPDYPLAPEQAAEDVFKMVVPLYRQILSTVKASQIILMGDSAGGGLSLALAQVIREEGLLQPSQMILLSPWLDVTLSSPEISSLDWLDPMLNLSSLRSAGRAYSGKIGISDHRVSPIHGSMQRLCPISVFIGTHDVLLADCRKLQRKAREEKAVIHYREYEKMIHVWMLFPMPEARAVFNEIASLIENGQPK